MIDEEPAVSTSQNVNDKHESMCQNVSENHETMCYVVRIVNHRNHQQCVDLPPLDRRVNGQTLTSHYCC